MLHTAAESLYRYRWLPCDDHALHDPLHVALSVLYSPGDSKSEKVPLPCDNLRGVRAAKVSDFGSNLLKRCLGLDRHQTC